MRRALAHPLAPLVGVALAAIAYLLVRPATADMAAHAFRAWLFDTEGMTVWNAQWYGGHHVLGYSMLFAPLAAWPGPAWVGALGAVGAVAAFTPLARSAAPTPGAAAAATWLFGAGVMSNVVIGRMPFTLGIALAVTAWLCSERSARGSRWWLALAALLALCFGAREPGRGRVPDAGRGGPGGGHRAQRARPRGRRGPAGGDRRRRDGVAVPGGRRRPLRRHRVLADARRRGGGRRARGAGPARPAGGRAALRRRARGGVRDPDAVRAERAAAAGAARAGAAAARPARRRPAPRARGRRRRARLPAVAAGRARDRRGARRPLDRGVVLRRRAGVPGRRGAARRAGGGRVHAQPLGGRAPRHDRPARARVGAPARREGQPGLLRRPAADALALSPLAARRGRALGRAPGRAARLLGRGRGAAAARRHAVPAARARVRRLADLARDRRRPARLRRRARTARRAGGLRDRERRADRGAPALHALLALRRRLRRPRTRRLDARHARARRAACRCARASASAAATPAAPVRSSWPGNERVRATLLSEPFTAA